MGRGAGLDLVKLQERLSQQYARLRDLRATENYPVYAIEHGLSVAERTMARLLLNADLRSSKRASRAYWLVWIAAAAEVGYGYDGSEYWDTFAKAFPNWPLYGDRNKIRDWYKRFALEFRGLTPSGVWAQHFPIIAWPITQAILPRYLQRHFADHLYQLRYTLARGGELTHAQIGDLLSERYYGGSSRFEGFLQQKALTARIVLALGVEEVADTVAPIEVTTLNRIVRDFDKLGATGSRLREARHVLRSARFINSSNPGFTPETLKGESLSYERTEVPRLVATPIQEQTWRVLMTIPDLAARLRKAGLTPHELERARMRFRSHIKGCSWEPARALFSYVGNSTEAFSAYPTLDYQVFEYDNALPQAEVALNECLKFPKRRLRLLKIRIDGSAFEITSGYVRSGQSYLLITAEDFGEDIISSLGLCRQQTCLEKTHLWRLDIGKNIGDKQILALKRIGLGYSLAIRVEPLGLSPRWNPTSGAIVFLDTEEIMFSVASDIDVQEFSIAVGAGAPFFFKPITTGNTFFSLGMLPVGSHRIVVSARGTATGSDIRAEDIVIEVRSALPWQKSIAGKAGVTLLLNPRHATFENFLDGNAVLRLSAPSDRRVQFDGRFYDASGSIICTKKLSQCVTPISDQKLSDLISRQLNSENQVEYLERAVRIEILASLVEYGTEAVIFEKDAEPLRWNRLSDNTIKLSDDSAGENPTFIECYDLSGVESSRVIEHSEAISGVKLVGKGGLLVAAQGGRCYSVIATAIQSQLSSFGELSVPANLSTKKASHICVVNALRHWQAARRLIGPMAFMARRNAIRELEQQLELLLCGEDWFKEAASVHAGKKPIGQLYSRVFYSTGYASGLCRYKWRYELDQAAAQAEFLRLAKVYKVIDNELLCNLALKFAFSPAAISSSELSSQDLFEKIKKNQALIRGAYFARLAANIQKKNSILEIA